MTDEEVNLPTLEEVKKVAFLGPILEDIVSRADQAKSSGWASAFGVYKDSLLTLAALMKQVERMESEVKVANEPMSMTTNSHPEDTADKPQTPIDFQQVSPKRGRPKGSKNKVESSEGADSIGYV